MEPYSVLMAVYERELPGNLRVAVESMLVQTPPPAEFVLVCDGPLTPELDGVIAEFCRAYPEMFRILRLERNWGLGAALNVGLKHCKNEIVARLDSDDIALPDRMRLQLEAWNQRPGVSALGGQIAEFSGTPDRITGYRWVPGEPQEIRSYIARRSPMNHTTVLLRKSHILQVGGYEEIGGFEDYFLWIKLVSKGFVLANVPQICCAVRADAGMYQRRGGWRYFRNTVKMETFLLRSHLIDPLEYAGNVAVRFCGTVLLPVKLRRLVFLSFLRKSSLGENPQRLRGREPFWTVTMAERI